MSMASILANKGQKILWVDPDTGKRYEVSYLTQKAKTSYQQWLQARARKHLADSKAYLSTEEYERDRRALNEGFTTGEYDFHGELAERARKTPDGSIAMAAILFGISEEEMADLGNRHDEEIRLILEQVRIESTPKKQAREGNAGEPDASEAPAQ